MEENTAYRGPSRITADNAKWQSPGFASARFGTLRAQEPEPEILHISQLEVDLDGSIRKIVVRANNTTQSFYFVLGYPLLNTGFYSPWITLDGAERHLCRL